MRIQINIEKQYDEIEVHIYANEYNVQIEQLMKQLKKRMKLMSLMAIEIMKFTC